MIAGPPARWTAKWFNNRGEWDTPPAYAGLSWRRLEI
jgi:hypothetical protein